MKQLLALLPVFSRILFFMVFGALNLQYGGSEETPIFKITIIIFGFLGAGVTFWEIMKKEIPLSRSFWVFVVFLPLIITTSCFVEVAFHDISQPKAFGHLLVMAGFSYTCIVATIYIAEKGFRHFAKWIDVFMLIFTLAAYNAIKGSLLGGKIGVGGATYQDLSYYCAFAFNLNLCGILFGNQAERFAIFKTEWFGKLSYILLLVQLTGAFLGGGRGATVYLVLNALLLLILSKRLSRTLMGISVFASILLIGVKMMQESKLAEILSGKVERAFSFIDSSGQLHGEDRYDLYEMAWDYCKESHLMGTGLFTSNNDMFYPHNFFMELLIQGGVIYCLFWVVMLMVLFYRFTLLYKKEKDYYLIPIFFFPLVELMFSGSYTITQLFWFLVVYIIARSERIHL